MVLFAAKILQVFSVKRVVRHSANALINAL